MDVANLVVMDLAFLLLLILPELLGSKGRSPINTKMHI